MATLARVISEQKREDHVFSALASRVRRRMLDLLRERPRNTTELAGEFAALSRFAVMQHLKVLGRARLVVSQRSGRNKVHYLNVVPIQEIRQRWMKPYEELFAAGLLDLKRRAEKT